MFDTNATSAGKPAIVLIHGAWADSSCWNDVVGRLQADGYPVYAPPNPLRSLTTDAASVADFLKAIPGPVILVGHSYGGAVISVASAKAGNVKALVFIDAFVPDAGESCLALLSAYPAPPSDLFTPVQLASGDTDLYFSPKYFADGFATGVDRSVSAVLAVTQRPVTAGALGEPAPAELGWKTLPNWYVFGDLDQAIPPPLKQKMADRARATITHLSDAGHLSMVQHPETTVAAIGAACESAAIRA
jgi:pimeloyl-ACP methyl ester carboxylesterase